VLLLTTRIRPEEARAGRLADLLPALGQERVSVLAEVVLAKRKLTHWRLDHVYVGGGGATRVTTRGWHASVADRYGRGLPARG
jgi:hypothetical protein